MKFHRCNTLNISVQLDVFSRFGQTFLLSILLLLLCFWSTSSYATDVYEIRIKRSEHQLILEKNGKPHFQFHAAFGSGGRKARQMRGDRRTPLGTYYITEVRSSDKFYLFMQLNYPNMVDAKAAYKEDRINKPQYIDILNAHVRGGLPPQDTPLGGSIGIHGIGVETEDKLEIHEIADWTQGCIAIRNREIDLLSKYIKVGTKVLIEK